METVQTISPDVGGLLATPGFKLLQQEKQLSRQEGRQEGRQEVAISLIVNNYSNDEIKKLTGLSQEQINELKTKL